MRYLLFSFICFGFTLNAQQFEVVLKGQIFNAPSNEVKVVQNKGDNKDTIIDRIAFDEKGNFDQSITLNDPDYYALQLDGEQKINLVLRRNDTVEIYGDGKQLFLHSNIVGSPASADLNEFLRYNYQYKKELDSANQYLRENQDKKKEIQQAFQTTFKAFQGKKKRFIGKHPNSPALIAVLPALDVKNEFPLYEKIVNGLEEGFGESPTVQRLVSEFDENKKRMKARQPIAAGSDAKEITLPNPDGDTLRLSDYEGKVVLLDFWASWCGPCRRENPNVVKLYDKYHEQGFEVFSVSLDRNKEKWKAAIEKDDLKWEAHVSDLKYFNSRAAQKYNVSSIPFTVLIDREGKVIATRLRGEALEMKLEELFND